MTQRILALDDEIHMLKLLERIITEKTPYQIVTSHNALELPALLDRSEFDLTLDRLHRLGKSDLRHRAHRQGGLAFGHPLRPRNAGTGRIQEVAGKEIFLNAVFADKRHRAGLGSLFALLFGETRLRSDLYPVKAAIQDAVAVEIDLTPIRCFKESITFFFKQLAYPCIRRRFMDLDITSLTARITLQLAPRGVKGIPDRYIDVFIRFAFYHQLRTGHGHVDTHVVEDALVLATMRGLDKDSAAHDSIIEQIQLGRPVTNIVLRRLRNGNVTYRNLEWKLHTNSPTGCSVFRRPWLTSYSTLILTSFRFASSVLGNRISNTPSLKLAWTLSAWMSLGISTVRVKLPYKRSE